MGGVCGGADESRGRRVIPTRNTIICETLQCILLHNMRLDDIRNTGLMFDLLGLQLFMMSGADRAVPNDG